MTSTSIVASSLWPRRMLASRIASAVILLAVAANILWAEEVPSPAKLSVAWVKELNRDDKQIVEFDLVNTSQKDLDLQRTGIGWIKGVTVSLFGDKGEIPRISKPWEEPAETWHELAPGKFQRQAVYLNKLFGHLPRGRYRLTVSFQHAEKPAIRLSKTMLWLDIDWGISCYNEIPEVHVKQEIIASTAVEIVPVLRTSNMATAMNFDIMNIGDTEIRYLTFVGDRFRHIDFFFRDEHLRQADGQKINPMRCEIRILSPGDFMRHSFRAESTYSNFRTHLYSLYGAVTENSEIWNTSFFTFDERVLHVELTLPPKTPGPNDPFSE